MECGLEGPSQRKESHIIRGPLPPPYAWGHNLWGAFFALLVLADGAVSQSLICHYCCWANPLQSPLLDLQDGHKGRGGNGHFRSGAIQSLSRIEPASIRGVPA